MKRILPNLAYQLFPLNVFGLSNANSGETTPRVARMMKAQVRPTGTKWLSAVAMCGLFLLSACSTGPDLISALKTSYLYNKVNHTIETILLESSRQDVSNEICPLVSVNSMRKMFDEINDTRIVSVSELIGRTTWIVTIIKARRIMTLQVSTAEQGSECVSYLLNNGGI